MLPLIRFLVSGRKEEENLAEIIEIIELKKSFILWNFP
jgi:hypothetical protein